MAGAEYKVSNKAIEQSGRYMMRIVDTSGASRNPKLAQVRVVTTSGAGAGAEGLGPPSQECHEARAERHAPDREDELEDAAFHHVLVEDEFVRQKLTSPVESVPTRATGRSGTHLDEGGVDQDARAERVKHAGNDARGCAVRVVRCAHPEPGGDPDGRRNAEEDRTQDGYVCVLMGQLHIRKPRANTKAFERLWGIHLRQDLIVDCMEIHVRWKMMTMKRIVNCSSTASVRPTKTLGTIVISTVHTARNTGKPTCATAHRTRGSQHQ